jgi:hypothetical protein
MSEVADRRESAPIDRQALVNKQTQPAVPFHALVLSVVAGASYAVAASPSGAAVRGAWDTLTLAAATWIGA